MTRMEALRVMLGWRSCSLNPPPRYPRPETVAGGLGKEKSLHSFRARDDSKWPTFIVRKEAECQNKMSSPGRSTLVYI